METAIVIGLSVYTAVGLLWGIFNGIEGSEGDRDAARRFFLTPVWPIAACFVGSRFLRETIGGIWRAAEIPTPPMPRLLRAKRYDVDEGALSHAEAQGGEVAVLPPPSRVGEPVINSKGEAIGRMLSR